LKEFTNMSTSALKEPCAIKPFGKPDDPRGFYHLLQQHINWMAVRNFSPSTLKKRSTYVRAFALWCITRDLESPMHITKPMIEAFQRHLFRHRKPNGKPLAWSSQHLHLKEVRQFFVWLTKQHIITLNPAAELDLPKLPRSLPKAVLTHAEVESVLQQPDTTSVLGLRDRALLETLYSTGIRRAEVCNLRLDHIHVDRSVLYIHRGKGQKDRYVPIGSRALAWIARYVDQAREKLCVDPNEQTLFLTVEGKPLHPDSLTEYASRYIKQSGVNKSGACHIFRHSMATAMHDGGADIRTIQAILGHERLDTTQIYTRVGLKKLLETHARTHPAERRDEDEQPPS
jgi:integrase/recombinase XerD